MGTKAKDWTYDGDYVTTVESHSQRGKFYDIKRTKGVLTCECSSYKFSKAPKSCRHLEAYHGSVPLAVNGRGEVATAVVVEARGETFTVGRRRGITFGGI